MPSTIIVDAMGGDNVPALPAISSLEVCLENKDISILLVGYEKEIFEHINRADLPENLKVINADREIGMGDAPAKAFREKGDSSIHVAFDLLVSGEGDAFFSAGNTGAVVTAAYFKSGVIPDISRPALATSYPSFDNHKLIILDLGATLDPKTENLVDFAVLGEAYKFFLSRNYGSRISILNIGVEENKGNKRILEANEILKKSPLNYTGYVEGNSLFSHPQTDVVVTDAFTGNVALKTIEGLTETISLMVKSNTFPRFKPIQNLVFNRVFGNVMHQFQYNLYGAAFLLGINHLVGVGHGRSDKTAFKNAILRLKRYSERGFVETFKNRVAEVKKEFNA